MANITSAHAHKGWRQAAVGCYWFRGPFTIASESANGHHGYSLFRDRVKVLTCVTWDQCEQAAERRTP
jgi:hypothetical protein